jgi:hypothetical protein
MNVCMNVEMGDIGTVGEGRVWEVMVYPRGYGRESSN